MKKYRRIKNNIKSKNQGSYNNYILVKLNCIFSIQKDVIYILLLHFLTCIITFNNYFQGILLYLLIFI